MERLKVIFINLFFLTLVSGCQTIKQKTDAIVEKENNELNDYNLCHECLLHHDKNVSTFHCFE